MTSRYRLPQRLMLASTVAMLLLISPIRASENEGSNDMPRHCKAEFRKCMPMNGACVWLGVPLDSSCDRSCQIKTMKKIQKKFPTGIRSIGVKKKTRGCVGFRTDLDGTEKGAICLANYLGYRYDPVGCNGSGWAYNVITN